ncbi:hypothetical protein FPV67DRAFT_1554850 [Lyophyllum atratum]|nr:hypothetical protein FPV67DRAFT_1554850 [Lyophyllum atratum]
MPSERIRASRLAEYKSTNYGVVNPRTLQILHDIIYDQKLDESIARRTGSAGPTHSHIDILPYSLIISTDTNCTPISSPNDSGLSSEDQKATNANDSVISMITQNVISRAVSESKYDAVICATGYQRSAWINLLKDSDIGKDFGLHKTSSRVQLLPVNRRPSQD